MKDKLKAFLRFLLVSVIGVGMFYLLVFVIGPFEPLSIYPAAVLLMWIGIAALKFLASLYHGDKPILTAIKENNITFGLVIIAYALIIAAAISTV